MPQITVHNIESPSRSDRVFWLLEELESTYDVVTYLRMPTLMGAAPPELFKHSLFGKGPALSIDGESFGESGYVLHRILTHPEIMASAPSHIEREQSNWSVHWAHAAEAAGMTWLQEEDMVAVAGKAWVEGRIGEATPEELRGMERFSSWYSWEIDRPQSQNFIDKGKTEQWLAEHEGCNFTGTEKFGIGDFMMLAGIHSLCAGSRSVMGYKVGPHIKAWWQRVSTRPQFLRALERIKTEENLTLRQQKQKQWG
ncbi:unnamed protein product [Clonostachys byssicola]|uniref:Glutathione S-transferase n=1 Tax=Clonostachys byssicola TaxID=160290 RepID=A0A9N9URR2_9HYPO|nr:unnamed protein product [Clonostachys byssicola]